MKAAEKTENKINTALNSAMPDYDTVVQQMQYERILMEDLKDSNDRMMEASGFVHTGFERVPDSQLGNIFR